MSSVIRRISVACNCEITIECESMFLQGHRNFVGSDRTLRDALCDRKAKFACPVHAHFSAMLTAPVLM